MTYPDKFPKAVIGLGIGLAVELAVFVILGHALQVF